MPEEADAIPHGSTHPIKLPLGTYLGFDFGTKRIGVACGNTQTRSAMPLCTIANHHGTPQWSALDDLVNEWKPCAMVVGKPLQMNGEEQDITHHAAGFMRRLHQRYDTAVFPADERHSSIQAEESFKKHRQLGLKSARQRNEIDKIAATHILQQWFDAQFRT